MDFSHQEAIFGYCQPQLETSLGVGMNWCCEFTRASVKINTRDEAKLFLLGFFFPSAAP